MKRIAFVIVTLCTAIWANAQIGLHIYKNDFTPGSVTLGSSFSFNAIVRNDSNSVFNGQISFGYAIDGAVFTTSDTSSGVQFSAFTDTLNSGDTVASFITVHVSGPQFISGPSVVVIWPIATNSYALDSLVLHLQVLLPNGIAGIDEDKINAFIINNSLMIASENEIHLKRVRIYDVLGQEVLDKQNPSNNIPLPEMNTGIYFAEIIYNNNQRKVFRFYH